METVDPVSALFDRAVSHGVPMSEVCDRASVARSTPSRWRGKRNGANLDTVKRLGEALTAIVAERQVNAHGEADTAAPQQPSSGKIDAGFRQVRA